MLIVFYCFIHGFYFEISLSPFAISSFRRRMWARAKKGTIERKMMMDIVSCSIQRMLYWNYRTDFWPSNVKNFINKILMLFEVLFFTAAILFVLPPSPPPTKKPLSYNRSRPFILYIFVYFLLYGYFMAKKRKPSQSHTFGASSVFWIFFFYYFNINFFPPEYLWVRTQFIIG